MIEGFVIVVTRGYWGKLWFISEDSRIFGECYYDSTPVLPSAPSGIGIIH